MTRRRSVNLFRRLRDPRGVSMIEAAFITPLLLLLIFSIVEFSVLFYAYLAIQNGVSQATRYAVTGQTQAGKSRMESVRDEMRRATPTLTIADGDFSFAHMPVGGSSWVGGIGGPGEIEKVTVTYNWNIMTPLIKPFFTNGKIAFVADSSMRNEGVF